MFLFMMVSLDGYFEGKNHDLSWHNANNAEFSNYANQQTASLDTIIFGKRTYDMMANFWPKPIGIKAEPVTAKLMNNAHKVVVSHKQFEPEWQNTRVLSGDIKQELSKLKTKASKDIAVFGSSNLCISLLEMKLLDELRIMVNPVVLGAGTPLFAGIKNKLDLKLLNTRQFDSGNVLLTYNPL